MRPRHRYWIVIGLVMAALLVGLPFALTALTAYSTRFTLRAQIARLNAMSPLLAIQRLEGGLSTSWLRLYLEDRPDLELDLQLDHRLLSSDMAGEIRSTDSATPLATLTGRIDYRPWNGATPWHLSLVGAGGTIPAGPMASWHVAPWKGDLNGTERQVQAQLQFPRFKQGDTHLENGDLHRVRVLFDLDQLEEKKRKKNIMTDNLERKQRLQGVSENHVHLRLQLAVAEVQGHLSSGSLSGGPATLDLDIHHTPPRWSFDLYIVATDLYHQGIPVLRLSSLQQHATGTITPTDDAKGPWWRGQLELKAASDFGPLRAEANVLGPTDATALLQSGRVRLHAALPTGLWTLLGYLRSDLVNLLERNGMTRTQAGILLFDALLQDGTWYAPTGNNAG